MSDRLTEINDRLTEIKQRAENATPGPWWFDGRDIFRKDLNQSEPVHLVVPLAVGETFHQQQSVSVADAVFIAHAREDITWLCTALAEMKERAEKMEAALNEARQYLRAVHEALPAALSSPETE